MSPAVAWPWGVASSWPCRRCDQRAVSCSTSSSLCAADVSRDGVAPCRMQIRCGVMCDMADENTESPPPPSRDLCVSRPALRPNAASTGSGPSTGATDNDCIALKALDSLVPDSGEVCQSWSLTADQRMRLRIWPGCSAHRVPILGRQLLRPSVHDHAGLAGRVHEEDLLTP